MLKAVTVVPVTAALLFGAAGAVAQTVTLDNAWVRATRITLAPHARIAPSNVPVVAVNLENGSASYVEAGGQPGENRSDHAVEEVVLELKPNAPPLPSHPVTLDPTKLDAEHHVVIFENGRVRIVRNTLEPHLKGPMHEHSSYVVVYITDLHTSITQGDGKGADNAHKRGEVTWRDYAKHAVENSDSLRAVEVQVEFK